MKLSFTATTLAALFLPLPSTVALESCQLDTTTIKSDACFISNKCYKQNDARKNTKGSVTSKCQICDPSKSQNVWSVLSDYSASTADPPNDCSSVPTDTYRTCKVPAFEWAAYSTRTTARMYAMKGAVAGKYLYAGGFLKSTVDAGPAGSSSTSSFTDFTVTGPFSESDPTGVDAVVVGRDLTRYSAADGARENAGGSFGQYDVGIVKIDVTTGEPADVFVYFGSGLDEASGLCADEKSEVLAVSGHFTGKLSATMANGSTKSIVNSNSKNGVPKQEDQFHPNTKNGAGETGSDDGFVIKASSKTGRAEWMVHYPVSNKDSQIVGVDMDGDGNVYGAGYKCTQTSGPKVCDGLIAKFASEDGSIIWEKTLSDLGAAFWIKYDGTDDSLYYTGTTTYGGDTKDAKPHPHCSHPSCAVTGRLSAATGTTHWIRTVPGSPRWGVFDQSGDIELAADRDGPYLYVAFDDVGEGGPVSLDAGTSYAGCRHGYTRVVTPEYEITRVATLVRDDCPRGTSYVGREVEGRSLPVEYARSGAHCGSRGVVDACLVKYHKYTGLPIWAVDLAPIAGIVPSPDGKSIMAGGWYYPGRAKVPFDSVTPPGYLRVGGLGSQRSGIYNAQLSTIDGTGEFVLHSGGGSKDRLYDLVGDADGNYYNVGYSMNLVMTWGGTLTTTMVENDVPASEAGSEAEETHFLVSKLAAASTAPKVVPSCLTSCRSTTDKAKVKTGTCFIDGICYEAGDNAKLFGKECFVCEPTVSKTEWTPGSAIGTTHCFVDDICVVDGTFFWYQRRTWAGKTFSECQYCDAAKEGYAWSVVDKFQAIEGASPPKDCK